MLLQWKKKIEKQKAQTLFKAAASIAKLSTQFNNNENADDDKIKEAQLETADVAPQDNNRDAINEEDS
jgi:phage repressor protein C with HTH and peptisase S24 domain